MHNPNSLTYKVGLSDRSYPLKDYFANNLEVGDLVTYPVSDYGRPSIACGRVVDIKSQEKVAASKAQIPTLVKLQKVSSGEHYSYGRRQYVSVSWPRKLVILRRADGSIPDHSHLTEAVPERLSGALPSEVYEKLK